MWCVSLMTRRKRKWEIDMSVEEIEREERKRYEMLKEKYAPREQ